MLPGEAALRTEAQSPPPGLPSLLSCSLHSNLEPNVGLPQGSVSLWVTWGRDRWADRQGPRDSVILWIHGGYTGVGFQR